MTSYEQPTAGAELVIRRARPDEDELVADLFWKVRHENEPAIPPMVHPRDDVGGWVREVMFERYDVWVAEMDRGLAGFMALGQPDWIEHLYIDSAFTGHGLGGRFVDLAKQQLTGQIQLWTFQSNVGACRFYERHGFDAVARTDGDNEEGAPDVKYVYHPAS